MMIQDGFIGIVSIAIGVFALSGAVMNVEWCFELRKLRRLESWVGRTAARAMFGMLGLLLISLGIALCLGVLSKPSSPRRSRSAAGASVRSVDAPLIGC